MYKSIAACLRQMAAAGVPVDVSVADADVEIEQVGAPQDSMVFDLPDGRAGCIIDLVITNRTSKPIPIRDVSLRPPWPNPAFEWLQAGRDPFNYNFPGKGAPELPGDRVINHVLLERRILKPERPIEGCLLAVGNPKPEKLLLGRSIEFTLAIIGEDQEYAQNITLWVDSQWVRQPRSLGRRSGTGLFGNKRAGNILPANLGNVAQNRGHESVPTRKAD